MALVKCPDCGKSVSDKATACNACGCPIGGSSVSVGNMAFEQRIEEYKNAGYTLTKREGDRVKMSTTVSLGKYSVGMLMTLGIPALVFLVLYIPLNVLGKFPIPTFAIILFTLVALVICFQCFMRMIMKHIVTLNLTKIGKIEEVGNVLKKK